MPSTWGSLFYLQWQTGRFRMPSACALGIISGIGFLFGIQKSLRAFLNPLFTGGVVKENGICSAAFCESAALRGIVGSPSQSSPVGLASSPKGRALGMAGKFPAKPQSLRAHPLPLGGAVAQRLRGFESAEPEKTVKRSSRRTGVNLQFFPV